MLKYMIIFLYRIYDALINEINLESICGVYTHIRTRCLQDATQMAMDGCSMKRN